MGDLFSGGVARGEWASRWWVVLETPLILHLVTDLLSVSKQPCLGKVDTG